MKRLVCGNGIMIKEKAVPCRDYESDNGYNQREEYKERCDKLARIACAAMEELVKQGKEDFLVLKNEEVRTWWEEHVKADRKEKARIAEIERKERVRAEALARLSDEEKELLGLKPTVKRQRKSSNLSEIGGPVFADYETGSWGEYQEYSNGDILRIMDSYYKTKK
jgi:hypothetical protein